MQYYCNHCDTYFRHEGETDAVCPRCGVGVTTKNGMLTHPANKVMSLTKAETIISWLGWRGFMKAQYSYAVEHPELRPKKKEPKC